MENTRESISTDEEREGKTAMDNYTEKGGNISTDEEREGETSHIYLTYGKIRCKNAGGNDTGYKGTKQAEWEDKQTITMEIRKSPLAQTQIWKEMG